MANEWIASGDKACYNTSTAGFSLVQNDVLIVGNYYAIAITVSGLTQGKIIIESFDGKPEIIEDGEYVINGKALQTSLAITGGSYAGNVLVGCITGIAIYDVPVYTIEDCEGNTVYSLPNNDDVQVANGYSLYTLDWTAIDFGAYRIRIADELFDYISYCLRVQDNSCTNIITWTNNENAGDFPYSSLPFVQLLRVESRLWKASGKSIKRDVFRYSNGAKKILYAERDLEYQFTIKEMPEYLHNALMLGIDHDKFTINGKYYLVDQEDYQPKWRSSSNLAPVELVITEQNNSFINQNCS
jgi:predicted RecA/RadA family phage recombinase